MYAVGNESRNERKMHLVNKAPATSKGFYPPPNIGAIPEVVLLFLGGPEYVFRLAHRNNSQCNFTEVRCLIPALLRGFYVSITL